MIGRQSFQCSLTSELFRTALSRARTFGFMKDVEQLWAAGYALGSSLENSIVIGRSAGSRKDSDRDDDNQILNPGGLRYADEFVRHKTLDAIGDLALAGAPILGCFRSYRGGHKLNVLALKALLDDRDSFEFTEMRNQKRHMEHAGLVTVIQPLMVRLSPKFLSLAGHL